jgi:hypothetical protein
MATSRSTKLVMNLSALDARVYHETRRVKGWNNVSCAKAVLHVNHIPICIKERQTSNYQAVFTYGRVGLLSTRVRVRCYVNLTGNVMRGEGGCFTGVAVSS